MHFAPLRDSPIQQRPAEWFASACTSLPAAARARHERPTVFHPVTAYPLRPPRGARSCGDGSKLPLTAQDRARTVAFSPQDVYLVPWAQQMPVVVPSHNTKNGVAPSDQHWETAPRELGTEQSRARRNGAHWWRAKGEAGGPVTTGTYNIAAGIYSYHRALPSFSSSIGVASHHHMATNGTLEALIQLVLSTHTDSARRQRAVPVPMPGAPLANRVSQRGPLCWSRRAKAMCHGVCCEGCH